MTELLYQAAPFILSAVIVAGLWLLVKMWRAKPGQTRSLPEGVENVTGITGLLAAGVSVVFSAAFASSLGNNLAMSIAFVCVFLAVQGAEFTSSFHLGRAWAARNIGLVLATGAAMTVGIAVSIVAGQSLIANRVDSLEQARLQQSAAFQAAQHARESAIQKAQDLALDKGQADAAASQLDALQARIRQAEAAAAQWAILPSCTPKRDARGNPYSSKAAEACVPLQQLRAEAAQYQDVLNKWAAYQGAKGHAQSLLAEPMPSGAVNAELPWIAALSTVTGIPADTIKAHFNITIAGMGEFIGLLFLFLWGKSRQERMAEGDADHVRLNALLAGGFSVQEAAALVSGNATTAPARFVAAHGQERQPAGETRDAPPPEHRAEWFGFVPPGHCAERATRPVEPSNVTPPLNDKAPLNGPVKTPPLNGGRVGSRDTCQHCELVYKVMTWNQRFCSEACRVASWEKRTGARLRKGRR